MEETKEAVNPAESAPAEETKEVVNTPAEATTQENIATTDTTQTPDPAVNLDVDEFGVPWKNRAMEYKRKSEETIEKLPSMIEEAVKGSFQQYGKPQEQEYTIAQLEQFAQNQPEHRPWVEEKKAEILKKQLTHEVEEKFKAEKYQEEAKRLFNQSVVYVAQTYPDVFLKNPQGQVVGYNNQNPMAQQIDVLMRQPRFNTDPEGLMAAADIAFARQSRGINQQKEQKLKAEVKHLQKQTLVEGGSKQNVQAVPPHRAAFEKAKQTGNLKDIAHYMKLEAEFRKAAKEK